MSRIANIVESQNLSLSQKEKIEIAKGKKVNRAWIIPAGVKPEEGWVLIRPGVWAGPEEIRFFGDFENSSFDKD